MKTAFFFLLALTLLTMGRPDAAYAYVEPGTGSMLLQALLALVAGALVMAKIYWQRLKTWFFRSPSREETQSHVEPGDSE